MPCRLCWATVYYAQLFMWTCQNQRHGKAAHVYNSAFLIPQVTGHFARGLARFAEGVRTIVIGKGLSGATFGRTLLFPGELQAQFHGTKEGINLCAPGDSEGQDTRQSHILNFVHYIDVRVQRDLWRSAGQIPIFLSSLLEGQWFAMPLFSCYLGTMLNAILS